MSNGKSLDGHHQRRGLIILRDAAVKLAAQAHAEYLQMHIYLSVFDTCKESANNARDAMAEQDTIDCNNNNLLIINLSCSLFCSFGCLFFIFISSFFVVVVASATAVLVVHSCTSQLLFVVR